MGERLRGKVAIVTGGGRGLGEQIALAFAEEGAILVVVARTALEIERVAGIIRAGGGRSLALPVDVADEGAVSWMAEETLRAFGRVDILVNNAGTLVLKPLAEMTIEEWDRVLATNLRGPFLCTRAVLPAMLRQGEGAIINLTSVFGSQAQPLRGAYAASKFGLEGFSGVLAQELKPYGIRVNLLHPGGIVDTPLAREHLLRLQPGGWLPPQVIREPAVYLASDPSATGLKIEAKTWKKR